MRAPDFWHRRGVTSVVLSPLAIAYDIGGQIDRAFKRRVRLPVPVICVGNLVVGGAGKTPTAIAIAARLANGGRNPHFISRGYGGRMRGPVRVETGINDFRDVGDEPLLLAARAPTWVARDRPAAARAAVEAGADILVMDDGFQNPSLEKDLSLLVFDGGYGIGNGRMIPAGPLREPVARGLTRAGAALIVGDDETGIAAKLEAARPGLPILRARLAPSEEARKLAGRRVVAFAGIGRPEKFFTTLVEIGCEIAEAIPYPDHHAYAPEEIMRICEMASAAGAEPVTTEKDATRLPPDGALMVRTVPVELVWRDEDAIDALLAGL